MLGEPLNVEIERDYLWNTSPQRFGSALLEAFGQAEAAAGRARDDWLGSLTFMGIPLGCLMGGAGSLPELPAPERIGDFVDRQR